MDRAIKNKMLSTNTAQEMLRMMASPQFWVDQTILYQLQTKSEEQGREIISIRDNIRKQMKAELDQI